MTYSVDCVSDVVVELDFVVPATEEVIPIHVKVVTTIFAGVLEEVWAEERETQFALRKCGEGGRGESVVFGATIVGGEGCAGEGAEDGGKG